MNRKQRIIVSITGIFIVLLALVGLTYAYFLTRITGNENDKSISITTANLELVYGDGNNLVTASNIEPGAPITPKTFTVTNNGNAIVEDFNIYLEDVRNTLNRKTDLVYTITCENTTVGATSTECEEFEVVENEVAGEELVFPSVVSIIARDTLDPATESTNAEQHTYTITLTYKEMNVDQSEDMNKFIEAKVNIYDSKTKFLASEILSNVRKNISTKYVNPNMLGIEENTTIPGKTISLENEKIMSYTFDDYGTSYYYRGSVIDNYVNYSGMCWRIVRIDGNGNIKLVLADGNYECSNNVEINADGTFSGYSTLNGLSAFTNEDYESDYDKGLAGSDENWWEPEDLIFENSDTPDVLDKWAKRSVKPLDTTALITAEWCNDMSILEEDKYWRDIDNNSEIVYEEPINGLLFYSYNYGADVMPSLTCNAQGILNSTAIKYQNNLGVLTADELIFAGAAINKSNSSFYLMTNANSHAKWMGDEKPKELSFSWTMTPVYYGNYNMYSFPLLYSLSIDGNLKEFDLSFGSLSSVRPSIVLKANTVVNSTITGQNGTQSNPYVVE